MRTKKIKNWKTLLANIIIGITALLATIFVVDFVQSQKVRLNDVIIYNVNVNFKLEDETYKDYILEETLLGNYKEELVEEYSVDLSKVREGYREGYLVYDGTRMDFEYRVLDLTPPAFYTQDDATEFTVPVGTQDLGYYLAEKVIALDNNSHLTTIVSYAGEFDLNDPGTYTVIATARDFHNNVATKELTIIVE